MCSWTDLITAFYLLCTSTCFFHIAKNILKCVIFFHPQYLSFIQIFEEFFIDCLFSDQKIQTFLSMSILKVDREKYMSDIFESQTDRLAWAENVILSRKFVLSSFGTKHYSFWEGLPETVICIGDDNGCSPLIHLTNVQVGDNLRSFVKDKLEVR